MTKTQGRLERQRDDWRLVSRCVAPLTAQTESVVDGLQVAVWLVRQRPEATEWTPARKQKRRMPDSQTQWSMPRRYILRFSSPPQSKLIMRGSGNNGGNTPKVDFGFIPGSRTRRTPGGTIPRFRIRRTLGGTFGRADPAIRQASDAACASLRCGEHLLRRTAVALRSCCQPRATFAIPDHDAGHR